MWEKNFITTRVRFQWILNIFCAINDFHKGFEPWWKQRLTESSLKRRQQRGALCLSKVMIIMVGFHLSGYRTFKHYYSTKISVCHNRRIGSHKVMAEFVARGKTSVDWFYGFKLHLVINDQGELLG